MSHVYLQLTISCPKPNNALELALREHILLMTVQFGSVDLVFKAVKLAVMDLLVIYVLKGTTNRIRSAQLASRLVRPAFQQPSAQVVFKITISQDKNVSLDAPLEPMKPVQIHAQPASSIVMNAQTTKLAKLATPPTITEY